MRSIDINGITHLVSSHPNSPEKVDTTFGHGQGCILSFTQSGKYYVFMAAKTCFTHQSVVEIEPGSIVSLTFSSTRQEYMLLSENLPLDYILIARCSYPTEYVLRMYLDNKFGI